MNEPSTPSSTSSVAAPTSPAQLIQDLAGARPRVLKLVVGLGVLDVFQLLFLQGAGASPVSRVLTVGLVSLCALMLVWLWCGSRVARAGLAVFHGLSIALALGAPLFSSRPVHWSALDVFGLVLSVAIAALLWQPTVSAWLAQSRTRRDALPAPAQRQLAKFNLQVALGWVATPLIASKAVRGEGLSPSVVLALTAPVVLAGLAVLVVNGLRLLRSRT